MESMHGKDQVLWGAALRCAALRGLLCAALVTAFAGTEAAQADVVLTLHAGQFEPRQLEIPAGTKTRVVLRNQEALPAEFESESLSREVLVPAHAEVAFYVGPLDPGAYDFFNDFNHAVKGQVVAKSLAGGH